MSILSSTDINKLQNQKETKYKENKFSKDFVTFDQNYLIIKKIF